MVAASGSWSAGSRSFKSVLLNSDKELLSSGNFQGTHRNEGSIWEADTTTRFVTVRHKRKKGTRKDVARHGRGSRIGVTRVVEPKQHPEVTKAKRQGSIVSTRGRDRNGQNQKIRKTSIVNEAIHRQEPLVHQKVRPE